MINLELRKEFTRLVTIELERAYVKHGQTPWGRHEFYAILLEEVDELWNAIKADAPQDHLLSEIIQIAAMCYRYIETVESEKQNVPNRL